MTSKLWLALLPAVCLYAQAYQSRAQQSQSSPCKYATPAENGRIAGVAKDQSGAVIAGARIEARSLKTGANKTTTTNGQGRFAIDAVKAGNYYLTATAVDFQAVVIAPISVTACSETDVNIDFKIAPARAVVEVISPDREAGVAVSHAVDENDRANARNTAELLADTPGVSLRENGQLASVPILHGLGDERTKLVVDGMTVSSSCPNHMNPPLSTVATAQAAMVSVMAGITPVSLGGDSLGGTIAVESEPPVFAHTDEGLLEEGTGQGFYRSNGQNYGGSFTEWVAGRNLGEGYTESWTTNDNYSDGSGHKVTSTYAQSTDYTVTLAAQGAGNLLVIRAGVHHTPYEGFVSAQMDMVRNYAETLNLHYRRNIDRGAVDAHVYWQGAWHAMNIGRDKSTFPMPMNMPMHTHGRDLGYSGKLDLPLSSRHTLAVGNELHRFVLDDRWPAVAGTAPMMGPNTFVSINDGRRTRLGTFAEVASKWNAQWTTLLGLRNDTVWTNAGAVQGYSAMMYGADADAFNALNRAHTDADWDATAIARYEPNAHSAYEFGYARKSRAPNLYERYAWSTNMMASGMIGWFGDGNYYVSNVSLKPETAHTVSGTAGWRDGARREWDVKLAPYMTYIEDYVDVDTLATATYGMSTFAQLRFANHNARIAGVDFDGSAELWNSARLGRGKIEGVGGWLHGERLDTSTPLYQMMPVHARVQFDEELKEFAGGIGVEATDRKANVDPHRHEQATPGYVLVNMHAGYQLGHLRMNAGADNVFNKCYELPLGGVNFDDFMASGWMAAIKPLTGRGRSAHFRLSAQF
jgi:iron complex outermembrane receptor protein